MGLKRTFVFFSGLFLFACATSVHAPLPIKTPTYTAQIETAIKGRFQNNLSLCPGIRISNAPDATPDGAIAAYPAHVKVRGLALAVAPVEKGCLSSGFGPRQLKGQPMRPHRGLDIAWAWPTDVYAAAAGTVVNVFYTASYGKTLVLDHGAGVYTLYAHLDSYDDDATLGARLEAGARLGVMGTTASPRVRRHLHYEILTGDYDPRRNVRKLQALNAFDLPSAG